MNGTRGLAIAIGILVLASSASAQDRRAIVLGFSGPGSGAAEAEVRRTIEDAGGWEVVDEGQVDRAATRLGRDPGSREVAGDVGASAILDGRVTKRGRRHTLRLVVRDPATGSTLAEESFGGRGTAGLREEIRSELVERVGSAMAQGRVPTVIETGAGAGARAATRPSERTVAVDAAESERDEDPIADASSSDAAGPSPLWAAIGASAFSRDLSYTDDLFGALRPYQLPIGIAARVSARWYPGAHFTRDFLANVGLDVTAGGALGLRSRQRDGTVFPTESIDFRAGADVRIPLAPIELGVGLGYGIHTFALGAAEGGNVAALPNVEYQFLRPAVRVRGDLGAGIYLEGAFGWRVLTSTGGLSQWFPRSSGSGLDAGAYVGWESDLGVGARAGFEMQRYFFAMSPEPGDANVAGGAVDQFLAGTVELVWRMR